MHLYVCLRAEILVRICVGACAGVVKLLLRVQAEVSAMLSAREAELSRVQGEQQKLQMTLDMQRAQLDKVRVHACARFREVRLCQREPACASV